ncbi:DUF5995 family protein [Streptomyces sp. NPDC048331]|uniref:DUF5995 family protein n=1 Tax=Streptomyces sp. NPDC048331 TaxID=3365534 RepID=UPI0037142966
MNYDLGLVVHNYLEAHRERIDAAQLRRYHYDYLRVNRILKHSMLECADVLIDRYRCPATITARYLPLGRRIGTQAVMLMPVSWRHQVWRDVLTLWNAPDERTRVHTLRRMDRRAERIAQTFATGPSLVQSLRRVGTTL